MSDCEYLEGGHRLRSPHGEELETTHPENAFVNPVTSGYLDDLSESDLPLVHQAEDETVGLPLVEVLEGFLGGV